MLAFREEGDGFFYSNRNWFTHGAGTDDLIAVTPDAGQTGGSLYAISPKSWYYHTDHQGSVRALSDDLGNVANSYSYDSYGNADSAVESYPNQPFRYTGQEYDPDTGLAQYRARWLDMASGRFLQEDPMGFDAGDLNVYRYVGNNPVNFVDPSGMTGENTATTTPVLTAGGSIASVGRNLACSFTTFAGIIAVAGDIGGQLGVINPAYGEVAGMVSDTGEKLGCGVRFNKKISLKDACGKTKSKIVNFIFSALGGLKTLNSFSEDTPVLTKQGTKQIKDIAVGDIVAARDEKTGDIVWRHVVEKFERTAPSSLHITLENSQGVRETITTTSEHPFHIEDWDGKVETMVADLGGSTKVDPARLFPSDGKTPFGEWVKAGALKAGDQVSNLTSIKPAANDNSFGPRAAANDNKALTITNIANDSAAARVYNFEVESRDDEITHNYFVGDEAAWVHNARKPGMSYDPSACGAHCTFKYGPDGRINGYQEWWPQTDCGSPHPFKPGRRFRGTGGPHNGVNPPYINEPGLPARPPEPWELPHGY